MERRAGDAPAFGPVSPYTETNYVKCGNCSELYVSKVSVFDLPGHSGEELVRLLGRRIPLIPLTLRICGVLLFAVPVIGLGVNATALLLNWRRRRHWTRTVSLIGTIAALFPTVAFTLWIAWEELS
jgi:hypothetical protein